MPGNLDTGDSSFFVGYREQMSNGPQPALPVGNKRDPFLSARKMALKINPYLNLHDLDYLEHLISYSGAVDKMRSPEFGKLLEGLVREVSESKSRVVRKHIRDIASC